MLFVHSRGLARAHLVLLFTLMGTAAAGQTAQPASSQPPISLPELLARVAREYPRIAASNARIVAAAGARRAAGVLPNPVVSIGIENARLPGHEPAAGVDHETMATATLPLEFLFQRGARVRRAEAELAASRADAFAERQRIALEAARAYYRVATAQIELATAQDLLRWLDSLVAYNRARAQEGAAAEADLVRTELERDRAAIELTMRRADLVQARTSLRTFCGDSAGVNLAVMTPDFALSLSMFDAGREHGSDTSHGRPEVEAARARVVATGAGISVARSMLVREVGAMAGLKWSAGTTTLLAGLSLPLPLVDQNRGELARAKAERDAAALELTAVEQEARAALAGATETAALLLERVRDLAGPKDSVAGPTVRHLTRADEIRLIALGAYQEGAVPLFQVLDAARAWGESRTGYYRTLYAQHESVLLVMLAQGQDLLNAMSATPGKTVPRDEASR
ncbi:MAG TPA: TolC family protein [Gemmatimonadales bacterium]|nr:TolC family protein [Gemmatimonadales bacterium]